MSGDDIRDLAAASGPFAANDLLEVDSSDKDSAIDDMEEM